MGEAAPVVVSGPTEHSVESRQSSASSRRRYAADEFINHLEKTLGLVLPRKMPGPKKREGTRN
jgi:hypothetical protein